MSKPKSPPKDPEKEWRRVIRMRCEWQTILRGSWKNATVAQITSEEVFHWPEKFGPPIPAELLVARERALREE